MGWDLQSSHSMLIDQIAQMLCNGFEVWTLFLLLLHCGKTTESSFLETDSGGVNAAWSRSAYCSEAH